MKAPTIAAVMAAIAAMTSATFNTMVQAHPNFLPDCSLVTGSAPDGDFGKMGIPKFSTSTTGCVITIENDITEYTPNQSYTVTVTTASDLAVAIGVIGGQLTAGGSGQIASLTTCRYQDPAQAVTTFTFVAPASGKVEISAICGRKTTPTMHSAPKLKLKSNVASAAPSKSPVTPAPTKAPVTSAPSKAPVTTAPSKSPVKAPTKAPVTSAPSKSPVTPTPTKAPVKVPTQSPGGSPAPTKGPTAPTKSPVLPCSHSDKKSCKKDKVCKWKKGECSALTCTDLRAKPACVAFGNCEWVKKKCVPKTESP